jgi:hypothetical protein
MDLQSRSLSGREAGLPGRAEKNHPLEEPITQEPDFQALG